jgi:hypothetical protein
VGPYLEHGARDEVQARVWALRDQGGASWDLIAFSLNENGYRQPSGREWTRSTAQRTFGEPAWRFGDA